MSTSILVLYCVLLLEYFTWIDYWCAVLSHLEYEFGVVSTLYLCSGIALRLELEYRLLFPSLMSMVLSPNLFRFAIPK